MATNYSMWCSYANDSSTCTATTTTGTTWKSYGSGFKVHAKDFMEWGDIQVAEDNRIRRGKSYDLPDGAKLIVDKDGNYRIDDKDAKVTYKANRIRDFSPHLNASDMLAEFVKYVRGLGVADQDVLRLPLHLFVSWLVIEAAQRDGDAVPDNVLPVTADPAVRLLVRPKCLLCGRFIPRLHIRHQFPFCTPAHGAAHATRLIGGGQLVPVNAGTL